MTILYLILDASAVVCVMYCLRMLREWRYSRRANASPPPGPKGLPLIGNYFDMPETDMWEAARKWGEEYGPLVHIRNFGTSYIFVNSYQTAVDLFEKHSPKYSSRPRIVMADLEGWDWFLSLHPYNAELRSARRLLHRFFQPAAIIEYNDLLTQSAHRMLERLLDAPDSYPQLLRQSVGESILLIAYGYRALPKDDPFIALIEQCFESVNVAIGFSLVNAFPPLRYLPSWFPGAGFQKTISEGRELSRWMVREPHEMGKKIMSDGTAASSMTSKLMDTEMDSDGAIKDEALIAKVTGVAYAGGADTSVSSLHTFLLAMVLYPEAQQRAQAELDQVVGENVLPSFKDRPKLPYVEAIVKETLRWQPVTPLGVARFVDEDDDYNGHVVPAGATIFLNVWAIVRNPEEYPEPEKFIPERWLPAEGKELPFDVYKVAFGVGRRTCPGRNLADNTIFIFAASILSSFNITKALDKDGLPITPRGDYESLTIRHPMPFEYVLTPRSDKMNVVIHQTVESAK